MPVVQAFLPHGDQRAAHAELLADGVGQGHLQRVVIPYYSLLRVVGSGVGYEWGVLPSAQAYGKVGLLGLSCASHCGEVGEVLRLSTRGKAKTAKAAWGYLYQGIVATAAYDTKRSNSLCLGIGTAIGMSIGI